MKLSKPKLIVSGTKTYTNKKAIGMILNELKKTLGDFEIVVGNDKGPEEIAKEWAEFTGVDIKNIPVDWKDLNAEGAEVKEGPYGPFNRKAGVARTKKVVEYGDYLLAFWDGEDIGTKILISFADGKELKKKIFIIQSDSELKEQTSENSNDSDNLSDKSSDDDGDDFF